MVNFIKNQDSNTESPIERAKKINILDVAQRIGLELKRQSSGDYRGKSLDGGDNDTCLTVNPEKNIAYDFKTKETYDTVGLYAKVEGLSQFESALDILGESDNYDGISYKTFDRNKRNEQLNQLARDVDLWHKLAMQNSDFLDYMHSRRITDETIRKYKIGIVGSGQYNEGRIAIPYYKAKKDGQPDTDKPLYCIFRHFRDNEPDKKYKKLAIGEKSPFSELRSRLLFEDTIPRREEDREELFIGEGVFDGASVAQELYSTLCFGGGNPNKDNLAIMLEYASSFQRNILIFDSDKSGEQFTYDTGLLLMKNGIEFEVIRDYGKGHKDLSDFYTDGGNIEDLLKTAQNGYSWLCEMFLKKYPYRGSKNNKIEAKKELREFYRTLKKAVEGDLLIIPKFREECQKNGYSEEFLKEIDKEKEKQKYEVLGAIRDIFLSRHTLFSYGDDKGACYYEYKNRSGDWVKVTSGYLKSELAKIFERTSPDGYYKPSDLNQTFELIQHKIALEKMPDFNTKPLWRFKNCILNLKTGQFHNPQPDDFISGGMRNYDYKPDADCPKFEKFLYDITGGEENRINTIWKFIAYILFPDNRLGQAPLFIGEEGSGKSTLLEVIQALVQDIDNQNVTNIQPKSMSNPFTRSNLQYSLLNIADDVHKSLGKGLSYIKNAITGQPIDVERKFEKNISIRPRAKWFLSANELPKAETLLGLERRLIFVRVVGKFGVGKDAKQANLNMADELKQELSGIFNKAYEIYKQMIISGEKITPCIDQNPLMSEFKEMNNEVLQFIEDNINIFIANPTLIKQAPEKIHENYITWAKNLNRKEFMTKKQFSTELNRLIKKGDIKGVTKKHFENGDFYLFEEVKNPVQSDEAPTQSQELKEPQQKNSVKADEVPKETEQQQEIKFEEEPELILDERTQRLMELVRYYLSFDKNEFNRELRRVRGAFEAMLEFLRKMQAKQGDKWKIKQYQLVIDELEKVA